MSTYTDFFFRSNMSATGNVPAPSPLYRSPDIICAQTSPIEGFRTVLKDNYATQAYTGDILIGYENYFYVRGKNLSAKTVNRQISLYYTPSALINWPSQWIDNVLTTDQGHQISQMTDVAPGAVGVAPDTFLWKPGPVPGGSDHYCMFSYATDPTNPQPIPGSDGMSVVDMAALVSTNLNIGWRNVSAITNQPPTWTKNHDLSLPAYVGHAEKVAITLTCDKVVGASVAFQGSNYDGADKPVKLDKTTITDDGQIVGKSVTLQPGFQCVLTVDFWSNGLTFPPGAGVTLGISFDGDGPTSNSAVRQEIALRNLINHDYVRLFKAKSTLDLNTPIALGAFSHIYV